MTLESFPTHLCKPSCLVHPGEEEGEAVIPFPWNFSSLTRSLANLKAFNICALTAGVARGRMVPWWMSSSHEGLKLLSRGPWPLLLSLGTGEPSMPKISMADLLSPGLPDPIL